MNAIVGWADDSSADTLAAFVSELDERVAYQVEPDKAGVELATIHAAKGLEVGRRLPSWASRRASCRLVCKGRRREEERRRLCSRDACATC